MPAKRVFCDSNVFLYSRDDRDTTKQTRAGEWLRALSDRQIACTNLQTLNEITNVLLKRGWLASEEEVWATVEELSPLGVTSISVSDCVLARRLRHETRYSWWDCLLLASALGLGCSHFLSEDLQDGQRIGPMTVIDPFRHHPSELLGQPGN
jgi:predicted nucleic acid-binding protein